MKKAVICIITILIMISSCYSKVRIPFTKKVIPYQNYINKEMIKEIKIINTDCKSVDWSRELDLIVTAKKIYDDYYDVVVFKSSGEKEVHITHDKKGCPDNHNGNPCWHPSGKYIVFTAQNQDALGYFNKKKGIPGTGMNCNLFLTDSAGKQFWQLTRHETSIYDTKAVIHPQFSRDGKKLFWTERVKRDKSTTWGAWVLKIADFKIENDIPVLENKRSIQPVVKQCFYESHDFNLAGTKILFSGNLEDDQHENGLDIYEYDLETKELINLTKSREEWDEHAHYSHDGKKILWMSSKNLDIEWGSIKGHKWRNYLKTELWIMDSDGKNKTRLTYFNKIPRTETVAEKFRVIVSDSSWSPDGKFFIATVVTVNGPKVENNLMIFKLK